MSLEFDVEATFTAEGADPFTVDAAGSVAPGETLVVLGPSGSGKSLLLESLAGFHDHEGRVVVDGRDVTDAPPERRGFGFVFQDYALFPHMTVRENVAFGARYHEAVRDPDELLASLGVSDLAERSPRTLSGGEAQRVALARALAVRPTALLLDEPLSALDVPRRQSLRGDLADALADVTGVYVTHNRTTARALADRIAVVRDGQIVQAGPPEEIFEMPASAFVARFVGANVLSAAVAGVADDVSAGADGAFADDAVATASEMVAVRPEHVVLDPAAPDATATVERVVREDATCRVALALDGERLEAFAADPPVVGDQVGIGLPDEHLTRLDGE